MKTNIIIQNVVASAKVHQNIDLKAIVRYFPMVEYRPERFPGLVFRTEKPKSAILVFASGKFVCTGTKSEKDARRAVKKMVKKLEGAEILQEGNNPEIVIQNIVSSVGFGNVMIDIERSIYELHGQGKVMYEPDMFPGAIYRMKEPEVVFLIFTSGKLVCVGAKKEEEIYRAVAKLHTLLEKGNLLIQ